MCSRRAGWPPKRKKAVSGILLRYRETDTTFGVTHATATRLAKTLGLSETQVIHVALAHFARQNLPAYEPDDGPLTYPITPEDGIAYRVSGQSRATKFDMGKSVFLPCNDVWFGMPPGAPHGQTPKLGIVHPSLMRRAQAAFAARRKR